VCAGAVEAALATLAVAVDAALADGAAVEAVGCAAACALGGGATVEEADGVACAVAALPRLT
jgi:hypothetical protein